MPEILWRLENVFLAGNSLYRLEAVSLEIREGITAVLGCSGAGKSSLLNLLIGCEAADRGVVENRCAALGHSLPLYWVPQDYGLWPHLSVRWHLEAVAPNRSRGGHRCKGAACLAPAERNHTIGSDPDEVARLLSEFDLLEKSGSRPAELSQGERSRLASARALMADAAVLVMDEPLSSVDLARAGRFWRVIRRRLAEKGSSLVYTTHLPEMVLGEADRVVCLKEGKVLAEGPVQELYDRPPTREVAECFGETNWLTAEECRLWLGEPAAQPRSIRPERLEVVALDASCVPSAPGTARSTTACVESSRPKGAVTESDLRHERNGAQRTFRHRPPAAALETGARVALRLVGLLLAALLSAGCGGEKGPALAVSAVKHWSVPPEGTRIPAARALAAADGEVYALDTAGRILVFDQAGDLKREWWMPEVAVGRPEGICLLKDGRIAIADTHYHRIVYFDRNGKLLGMFGGEGEGPGQFIYPVDLVEDDRQNLYICEYGGHDRVQKFGPDGKFVTAFGSFGAAEGQFQRPSGLAWRDGKLYVADALNNRISIFEDTGKYLGALGGAQPPQLLLPYDICLASDGAFYLVEYGAGRVTRLSLDGKVLGRFGSSGSEKGRFATPWGLTVDSQMHVLVADTGNRRIVELIP